MAKITIAPTGETFECADGATFLQICEDNDVPFEFGCMNGSCATCVCAVEVGADNVAAAAEDEADTVDMATDADGARLGCQLVINGDVTIRHL